MLSDIEVNNLPPVLEKDDETISIAEVDRRDGEEVKARNLLCRQSCKSVEIWTVAGFPNPFILRMGFDTACAKAMMLLARMQKASRKTDGVQKNTFSDDR